MIVEYVRELAAQSGVSLTKISVINGKTMGCLDSHLVYLYAGGLMVSTIVYQSEVENLQNGISCDGLETRIRVILGRLLQN